MKNCVNPFVHLFEISEKWNKDDGYFLYAFDLGSYDKIEQYMSLIRQGNTRLKANFATFQLY